MKKRLLPLIAIAFVVAVISTALFYTLLAGRLNSATAARGPAATMVVANRDLKAGMVLTAPDLTTVAWAGGELPKGTFGKTDEIIGKTVFDAIPQGEPVVASRLVSKDGTGIGIPEGMRAVSVHVSDSSGVVGLLRPGYKVDVQVFASRSAKAGAVNEMRTLLRGVTVLGISPQPEPSSQGYFAAPVVTLLAAAHDAEELALADSYARLRLTLRNPLEPSHSGTEVADEARKAAAAQSTGLDVRTLVLTDEGFSGLMGAPEGEHHRESMRVLNTGSEAIRVLLEKGLAEVRSESSLSARMRRFAYYEVPQQVVQSGRARIGLLALDESTRVRVRPEVWDKKDGRTEARSLETEVALKPGNSIVVSGFVCGSSGKFRHAVVLIASKARS